jgi:hypothetical protein
MAREAVGNFLLEQGQTVQRVRQAGTGFIVESDDWWLVEPIDSWPNFTKSGLYDLFEVRLYMVADPPPVLHGFGVPHGSNGLFHLNDAGQFRAFFAAVPGRFASIELAGLLVRYADSEQSGLQTLIRREDDLRKVLYAEHLEMLADKIGFHAVDLPDDHLDMDFSSYYLVSGGEGHSHRVALNRWHVEVGGSKQLTWDVEPLAVGMPSPLFG